MRSGLGWQHGCAQGGELREQLGGAGVDGSLRLCRRAHTTDKRGELLLRGCIAQRRAHASKETKPFRTLVAQPGELSAFEAALLAGENVRSSHYSGQRAKGR